MGTQEPETSEVIQAILEQAGVIWGPSPAMKELLDDIVRVADSDLPIMITGATGTGKEIIAFLLHQLGSPPGSPFLDVNCGAIPETLIESQLFGHEKGAFTGATSKQEGYFSLASSGVLFLDEIAELPLWQQTKLLRVLETRLYRPIGGTVNRRFHGRIVTATHVDLEQRVEEKRFREDLYYRLNIVKLRIPSLHERRQDIPCLVEHFAESCSRPVHFSAKALQLMERARWKGNVRELKNTVERIALMSGKERIDAEEIKRYITVSDQNGKHSSQLDELASSLLLLDIPNKLEAMEYATIKTALRSCDGNKSSAARVLGVHRKYIERKLNGLEEMLGEVHRLHSSATENMEQSRYHEAVKELRQAVRSLENWDVFREHDGIKLDLLLKLSACLRNIHGWSHSEVISLYEDAQSLTANHGDPERLNSVHFGKWANQLLKLNLEAALAAAAAHWREGERINNPNVSAQAAIGMANTHFWMGDYKQTNIALQQFVDLYSHDHKMVIDLGHDPFVYYLMFKALTAFQTGKPSQSSDILHNLLSYTREVNQPFGLATSLQTGAWLSYKFGDMDTCYRFAEELSEISRRHSFPFLEGIADIFIGHRTAMQGDYTRGKERITTGFTKKLNGAGGKLFNSMYGIVLADIALHNCLFEQGLADVEKTIAVSHAHRECCYQAEQMVMRGRLKLALKRVDEALKDFHEAMAEARERCSKAAELKGAYELAHYLYHTGSDAEARRLLTPIVLRFAEQKSYLDLDCAKNLLSAVDTDPASLHRCTAE